jgi:anti-sigma factor RsiW
MAPCQRRFDEALLSGYLDGALIQLDEQRVRVHLEQCEHCRAVLGDLESLRAAARSTRFLRPTDEQWQELPLGPLSTGLRRAGWLLVIAWAVATAAFLSWILWQHDDGWLRGLVFAGVAGFALLLASVLVDRVRALKTDPYREVEK